MRVVLPVPPSSNVYYRVFRGRAVKSQEARAYQLAVSEAAARQLGALQPYPPGVEVALTLHWFRAMRSGDLDNRLKVVLDSLSGIIYHDDRQVVQIMATRHDDPSFPRLVVEARVVHSWSVGLAAVTAGVASKMRALWQQ